MSELNSIDTITDEENRPSYEAPKLTVLDAGKTEGGTFVSSTEGPFSLLLS